MRRRSDISSLTCSPRRGSTYVIVLLVAAIVGLIGLSSMAVVRIGMRSASRAHDSRRAEVLALAAVEHAIGSVDADLDWRTTYNHGQATPSRELGGGTISFTLYDRSADVNLETATDILVEGTALVGSSVRVHGVRLLGAEASSSLGSALHSSKKVTVSGGSITCEHVVTTNKSFDAIDGAVIDSAVEAAETVTGGTYLRTTVAFAGTQHDPDLDEVAAPLVARGTSIGIAALPLSGGFRRIESVVLGPSHNPYGPQVDPDGVYVVDCQGADVRIRNARVLGTLVLVNAGSSSVVDGSVAMAPVDRGLPSLVVLGKLTFAFDGAAPLDEAALGLNLNPPGAPHAGAKDADLTDVYPSVIEGLVYVSSDLTVTGAPAFHGVVVVGGGTEIFGDLSLVYDPQPAGDPPPGFRLASDSVTVVPGSWTWATP